MDEAVAEHVLPARRRDRARDVRRTASSICLPDSMSTPGSVGDGHRDAARRRSSATHAKPDSAVSRCFRSKASRRSGSTCSSADPLPFQAAQSRRGHPSGSPSLSRGLAGIVSCVVEGAVPVLQLLAPADQAVERHLEVQTPAGVDLLDVLAAARPTPRAARAAPRGRGRRGRPTGAGWVRMSSR